MFEYNREAVAKRIKELRKKQGMTLKKFSEFMDIPVSSINSWERGVSIPRPNYLKKLSEKNNIDEKWILYGDVEDYVQDVFDYLDLSSKVSEESFFEIVDILENSNFEVGDYGKFEEIAKQVIDDYEELIKEEEKAFVSYIKPERIASQYDFLKNPQVQQEYLPFLNDLLSEERISDNGPIILFLIDALSRTNKPTKRLLKLVLRDINWLVTNNILLLDGREQSEVPKYYGVKDTRALDRLEKRNREEIEKEVSERINNIATRLKAIVEHNYEALKESGKKSIF